MAKKDKFSSRNADMNYFYEDALKTKIATNSNYTATNSISNIRLLDSTSPIELSGSVIKSDAEKNPNIANFDLPDIDTSSINANAKYKIYGSPEKWVFDNHQQYNNCGITSCLNILVMAGKMTIKDQNKTEKDFTKKIWDLGICQDNGVFGVLDTKDGGTSLDNYIDVLNMYDISSHGKYYGVETEADGEIKYIKVPDDMTPMSLVDLAGKIQEGKGVIASVASDILWGEIEPEQYEYAEIDHAICITGVVTNTNNQLIGFYIHDTGAWATRYISYNDLAEATLAERKIDIYDSPTAQDPSIEDVNHNVFCIVTDDDIKAYTDPTDATGNDLDNVIVGNKKDNLIKSKKGDDTVYGWAGADTIYGGAGDDSIYGYDSIVGNYSDGANKIYGEGGNDTIHGGNAADYIEGGAGNDSIIAYGGADVIKGGAGNDFIRGDKGSDSPLFGNDTIYGGAGDDELYGDLGDDVIYGDAGDDIISGDDGNDVLYGGAGNDNINGGDGDDRLWGQSGNNILSGGVGDDVIIGGKGNDTIFGGIGEDGICGGKGNDSIEGGAGYDTIAGEEGSDTIYGNDGNDIIFGDKYKMNKDDDYIATGSGNDILYGGDGDDTIYGCGGNDTIYGGAGNDRIYVGSGNNIIYTEEDDGFDKIDFGSGTTRYVINNHSYGVDTIGTSSSKSTAIIQYEDISVPELDFSYSYSAIDQHNELVIKEPKYPPQYKNTNILVYFNFKNTSKIKTYVIDETDTEYLLSASDKDGKISIGNTKSNNIFVTENEKSNNITTSKYSDVVYMADENDTITYTAGKDYYLSSAGNDTYNCNLFDENTYLSVIDNTGNDTLNIASDKSNVRLFFDLNKDGSLTDNTNLYITNKTVLLDSEALLDKFDDKIGGSVDVYNYFNDVGKIETVNCNNSAIDITSMVNSIQTSVVSWFSQSGHTGYNSVQDVLNTKNNDLIDSLLVCYTKDWA